MTETIEIEQITEVVALIGREVIRLQHRELVPAAEISDLLLDVRSLLALTPEVATT